MRGTYLVSPLGVGGNAQGPSPPSTAVHSMVSPSNRHQTTSQANGSARSAVHVPNHWIAQTGKPRLKFNARVVSLAPLFWLEGKGKIYFSRNFFIDNSNRLFWPLSKFRLAVWPNSIRKKVFWDCYSRRKRHLVSGNKCLEYLVSNAVFSPCGYISRSPLTRSTQKTVLFHFRPNVPTYPSPFQGAVVSCGLERVGCVAFWLCFFLFLLYL